MVGDIKEAHLDFSTTLVRLVSVKDLPGSVDESNPKTKFIVTYTFKDDLLKGQE